MPALALISSPSVEPAAIHADVWHAHALAQSTTAVLATGDALLDAQLPGGGWPLGALTELLQPPGVHSEWRLLLPALARSGTGPVVLVGAPHTPFAPSLSAQGLAAQRLLRIDAPHPAQRLWACEQVLRCADVDAVLAWLPQARGDQLRRLQMAAAEHHKLLFVMRPQQAHSEASPALLRLQLEPSADRLQVRLLKRRGPPLAAPLLLGARPAALAAQLGAAQRSAAQGQHGMALPQRDALAAATAPAFNIWGLDHALDRTAARA